jgi:hypothetical protein
MRFNTLLLLALVLMSLSGCGNAPESAGRIADSQAKLVEPQTTLKTEQSAIKQQSVSLNQADAANLASQAVERKIIRNANLTLEVTSPPETQRKISSIAESHQGFVVTSEATQRTIDDASKPAITVNLVVRVPAAQFNQTMEEIRGVSARIIQEKTTGQDVTEEFMDLEARIKNQKALEGQFLEIMKRAGKVEEALNVQRELAEVRTEIEKLEGRRRFLANQASLSTITMILQSPTQIVNAAGFWYSIRSAFADGVDAAAAIILFLIRAVIVLLPIVILIFLPIALIARFIIKRLNRRRLAQKREHDLEATT